MTTRTLEDRLDEIEKILSAIAENLKVQSEIKAAFPDPAKVNKKSTALDEFKAAMAKGQDPSDYLRKKFGGRAKKPTQRKGAKRP